MVKPPPFHKQPHSYTGSPTGSRRWIEEKDKTGGQANEG